MCVSIKFGSLPFLKCLVIVYNLKFVFDRTMRNYTSKHKTRITLVTKLRDIDNPLKRFPVTRKLVILVYKRSNTTANAPRVQVPAKGPDFSAALATAREVSLLKKGAILEAEVLEGPEEALKEVSVFCEVSV